MSLASPGQRHYRLSPTRRGLARIMARAELARKGSSEPPTFCGEDGRNARANFGQAVEVTPALAAGRGATRSQPSGLTPGDRVPPTCPIER